MYFNRLDLDAIKKRFKRNPTVKKIRWWLYINFPNIAFSPFYRPRMGDSENDKEINEESRLPSNEDLSVLAIWMVEAYGPSEINAFYNGMESLGWNIDRSSKNSNCVDWVKKLRQSGSNGTYNIGYVERPGENRFISIHDFSANLPSEIDYIICQIDQVCSSLTCIQIGFVLHESLQKIYSDELQLDRVGAIEPIKERPGAYHVLEASDLKKAAIDVKRAELKKVAAKWIQKNFPGIFSNGPNYPPSAELVVTRKMSLFDQLTLYGWDRLVCNPSSYQTWKKIDNEAIQFAVHEDDSTNGLHLVMTLPSQSLKDIDLEGVGSNRSARSIVHFINDQWDGILVRFTVRDLINSYRRDLLLMRDKLTTANHKSRKAIRSLDQIQTFFSKLVQVPNIAGEVIDTTKHTYSYKHYCDGFIEANPYRGESPTHLYSSLSSTTNALANRLVQDEKSAKESFRQISEIVAARESVRAQRRMELLSLVAIFVASLSLWATSPEYWKIEIKKTYNSYLATVERLMDW